MITIGELRGLLTLDDQLSPKMDVVLSKLDKSAQTVTNIGSKLTMAGATLTAAFTVPLVGLATVSATTFATFERGMNRVEAVSGATAQQMALLEQQAKMLGATTQYTATQSADAMGFLAMAGLRANDILGAMPSVLQLAASAQMDLGRAADITTNILTGYNMEVEDLGRVNDVLVKAFTSANTDLEQLGQAFKYAGPVAKAAGVSFEQSAAALALMGNAGIQASMAGTSLRGAITRLLVPTDEASQLMEELGINALDSSGKLLPLDQILEQLAPHADDAGAFMEIFGQRAGPAMAALVGQGADALRKLTKDLEESGGMADKVGKVQMEGLMGAWIAFTSATEGLAIAIGDVLAPTLTLILDGLTAVARFTQDYVVPAFAALPGPVKAVTFALLGVVAVIGPMLGMIGLMMTGVGSLMSAFTAVRGTTLAWRAATMLMTGSLTALSYLLPAIAVGLASWKLGEWIGKVTGASDAVGKLTARVGEFLGILPEGTTAQYDAMRAAEAMAGAQKKVADGIKETNEAIEWQGPIYVDVVEKGKKFLENLLKKQQAFDALDGSQKNNIRTALEYGATVGEIAEAFGLSEASVGLYAQKLEEAKRAEEDAKKETENLRKELEQLNGRILSSAATWEDFSQKIAQWTDRSSKGIIENFRKENDARLEADRVRRQLTLSTTEFEISELQRKAANEINALDQSVAGWERAADLINANTKAKTDQLIETEVNAQRIIFQNLDTEAEKAQQKTLQRWLNVGKGLSQTTLKAFQGGGDVAKSVGSDLGGQIGNWAGESVGKALADKVGGGLGKMLGGLAGGILGPLGSMAGGWLGGMVGKLFGGGEGKKVNDMRDQFVAAAGGIDALNQKAVAAGLTLDNLLRAKKVEDFNRAVQELNLGIENHAADLQLAKQAAEEFGIPMERMGQAFKQAEIDAAGGDLLAKIKALTSAGVDLATIVEFAGDDVGAFIQRAIEMGTTVPKEFERIAAQMIEQGTLIDANGDAFTELGQIPFAQDLNAQFSELMGTLNRFIDALTGIPPITIPINYAYQGDMPDPPTPMARGGVVTRPTNIIAGEAGAEAIIPLDRLGDLGGTGGYNVAELGQKLDALNQNFMNFAQTQPRLTATLVRDARNGAI